MPVQNIEDVYEFLDTIPTFKAEGKKAAHFSLEHFEQFCDAIGAPHTRFSSIHVAGSNGKGSTCQLLASVYNEAGYEVGLYTSPHILSYRERFSINGIQISESELVEFFRDHEALVKSFRLTYFEISTAIAFWWFARRRVDVAIIETGLGGQLDSTNIITPLASVITTVTLDHTDILGDTIEAIAAEKAGIIKQNVPVILGNIPKKVVDVFHRKAKKMQSEVFESTKLAPSWENDTYFLTENDEHITLKSTLKTPVQAYNIAVAWMTSEVLDHHLPVSTKQQKKGVENVGKRFSSMARFEKIHPEFEWYFDGAHNLQAVQAMKEMIATMQPVSKTTLILSLMHDKINKKMMSEFLEFKKIIYHTLPLERAAGIQDVRKWLPAAIELPGDSVACINFLKEFESELVIFAGSFYFYATVMDWLSSNTIDR